MFINNFENYRNKINTQSPRNPDNFQTDINIQNNLKEETKHPENQEFEERSSKPYPWGKKDISEERKWAKISRKFSRTFKNYSPTSHRIVLQGAFSQIIEEDQSKGESRYFNAISILIEFFC